WQESGTRSCITKRLKQKEIIYRLRTEDDERRVKVRLTDKGLNLKEKFSKISEDVIQQFDMENDDSAAYYQILKTYDEKLFIIKINIKKHNILLNYTYL